MWFLAPWNGTEWDEAHGMSVICHVNVRSCRKPVTFANWGWPLTGIVRAYAAFHDNKKHNHRQWLRDFLSMTPMFITCVSEVIMFSPCVFVTLFVCLCLYHDVCPDDLTMKDWCHTNHILQVHCWGYLVVQVMFHALMTSSMMSPGHKVGQILKVIYLRQYLS